VSELWPTHGAVVFNVIVRLHPEAGVWFALSAASISVQYVSTSGVHLGLLLLGLLLQSLHMSAALRRVGG